MMRSKTQYRMSKCHGLTLSNWGTLRYCYMRRMIGLPKSPVKLLGAILSLLPLYACMSLGTCFPLQGFVRDVFRYYNLSST